jgi:hypothetical protein
MLRHFAELQVENVNRPIVSDGAGDYVVAINGRRCVVWTQADWAAQRAWVVATIRPIAVINDRAWRGWSDLGGVRARHLGRGRPRWTLEGPGRPLRQTMSSPTSRLAGELRVVRATFVTVDQA